MCVCGVGGWVGGCVRACVRACVRVLSVSDPPFHTSPKIV